MRILELFCGTKSVSKALPGNEIISVDILQKWNPDICVDILNLDYRKLDIPDFIWASPPCTTYSKFNYFNKAKGTRHHTTAEPISDKAKRDTAILYKTLEIIDYFLEKNPAMKYCIENPVGMMRNDARMKSLPYMTTTSYNHFQFPRYKPTNFWSNYELNLPSPKRLVKGVETNALKKDKKIPGLSLAENRYALPPLLIKEIFRQAIHS